MTEPSELRARTFRLDGDEYLVLSFRVAPPARSASLTRAEWAVAQAVLSGARNAEIARQRGRSVNTVARQVASIFKKLGVRSRIGLARVLSGSHAEPHESGARSCTS
jgi:DNA-binding NarL/FixJ family response regulator